MKISKYFPIVILICIGFAFVTADAQENLAQQAYAIFEQHCLNCHGASGAYKDELLIERTALVNTRVVIPGDPEGSEFYKRLLGPTENGAQMPLNLPPLSQEAVETIARWITAGAPDWDVQYDINFITTDAMLHTMRTHLESLDPFDRPSARYFTMTHLHNAGESPETLNDYRIALSKLINSLSWRFEITNPTPIDEAQTIFYIDLRRYEWNTRIDVWPHIERVYPYNIAFDPETQADLLDKLTQLQTETGSTVPFVHVDWFLANASLPPLYHDILGLPQTDSVLETQLEVDVASNIRNAPGINVWRAGFNDSGVSTNNRVVERHTSRYGAYWKSYDFEGSADSRNIFTHPLDFTHDGGEIIFNLPNGLQAYFLVDAKGSRLNDAPIKIVSNPAASDPTVRNGLSCMGCHTQGMKTFEDSVRAAIEQDKNPPYNKEQALRLYPEQSKLDELLEKDTQRFQQALEKIGGPFADDASRQQFFKRHENEPVQRFHEAFQAPLDASHAAAAVGLETAEFLTQIREKQSLKNLGLQTLIDANGTVKRDAWTSNFDAMISALNSLDSVLPPVVQRPERIPGESVDIPDPNLRAAIAEALGKAPGDTITVAEMATLERLYANGMDISDLTGLEFATNLFVLYINDNLMPDLSPISGLTQLGGLRIAGNKISDISPLKELKNLGALEIYANEISDISPLAGLTNLGWLSMYNNPVSDLSPLANLKHLTGIRVSVKEGGNLSPIAALTNLEAIYYWSDSDPVPDLSPLTNLPKLIKIDIEADGEVDVSPLAALKTVRELWLPDCGISDLSFLENLISLERLNFAHNNISDVSPLAALTNLKWLDISRNEVSDFSPLDGLREQIKLIWYENPGFPKGGPKIEGPWLWAVLSDVKLDGRQDLLERDLLSEATGGHITEAEIAAHGAIEGRSVGNSLWTSYKLPSTGRMEDMLKPPIPDGAIYGSVLLFSPREQATTIYVGSYLELQVWLNGTLIHEHARYQRRGTDYTDNYPVTLQQGKNVLLVALHSNGQGFFGFEPGTKYKVSNYGIGYTFSKPAIHLGDTFTLDLSAENISDLAGWQFDISFNPAALEAVEVNEGDFLKSGGGATFFQEGTIDNTTGKITGLNQTRFNEDGATGTGTLLSVTFLAKAEGETQLTLNNFQLGSTTGEPIAAAPPEVVITIEGQLVTGDVNRDGQVNVLDMILVSRHFGEDASVNPQADVNRDGVINIQDLILVAQHLGESTDAAAPSVIAAINNGELTPATVQAWITQAQIADDRSLAFQQGIANLERLLALFIPEETALLHNYPNPFNPETWIPYQLAKPAEVTLTIYATNGAIVRTLVLGHQPAGIYQYRSRAAYWDGKNEVGESVASGVYFYTLTAGDFNATRKMLIRK